MTITRYDLNNKYAAWFYNAKNSEKAKHEILKLFSNEPKDGHVWTEQDIHEQSRKIIAILENEQ